MKITYLGHASLSIELNGKYLVVDPFISGNPLADKRILYYPPLVKPSHWTDYTIIGKK